MGANRRHVVDQRLHDQPFQTITSPSIYPTSKVRFGSWLCETRSGKLSRKSFSLFRLRFDVTDASDFHIFGIRRAHRDRRTETTEQRPDWLVGRQDSNLGMAESKSTCFAFDFKDHPEKSAKFVPFPINRLDADSECAGGPAEALWCVLITLAFAMIAISALP